MIRTLKNYGHFAQGILANALNGAPSNKLKIIAITGTDGKTTSTTLVYHILKSAGLKVALISTVAAYIGDESIDTGFHVTNPSSFALQKLLSKIKRRGIEYVVLEMTSHGIDQFRNVGIHPIIAGITNVTHEHLDYHKSFTSYLATKAKLLTQADFAFINKEAKDSFEPLEAILDKKHVSHESYTSKQLSKTIAAAVLRRFGGEEYNAQNAALATAVAKKLGINDPVIADAIKSFPGVVGRMQEIPNTKKRTIIVDFAHTPNALEQALKAVRKQRRGRGKIIVVFGCAGLRDRTKRPLMADIASRLADLAIFTSEDPRTEDIWVILQQMKSGVKIHHDRIVSIPDRFTAIEKAINTYASPGDTILITGKGHEQSMCFGTQEMHWSDPKAVEHVLRGQPWEWKPAK